MFLFSPSIWRAVRCIFYRIAHFFEITHTISFEMKFHVSRETFGAFSKNKSLETIYEMENFASKMFIIFVYWCLSSFHADCLTKCVKQFRLGIAINRRFQCSVFRVQGVSAVGYGPEH